MRSAFELNRCLAHGQNLAILKPIQGVSKKEFGSNNGQLGGA
jgi:hypothetical protein